MNSYRGFVLAGLIVLSLGIIFNVSLRGSVDTLGNVFITLGVFLLIVGMSKKRKHKNQKEK